MIKRIRSPLWYVGGKYWLIPHIWDFISTETREIASICFGGGVLEINLSYYRNIKIHAYDVCSLTVNFWRHWLDDPNRIIKDAKQLCRTYNREELRALKQDVIVSGELKPEPYMKAVYYYAFNRLGFQGMTNSKYILDYEEIDGVFRRADTGSIIFNNDSWNYTDNLDIEITEKGFEESLTETKGILTYIDPPYPGADMMYGKRDVFDHHALSEILKTRENWIMSYGLCPQIPYAKLAYPNHFMMEFDKRKGFTSSADTYYSTELLIFSPDIADYVRSQPEQITLLNP